MSMNCGCSWHTADKWNEGSVSWSCHVALFRMDPGRTTQLNKGCEESFPREFTVLTSEMMFREALFHQTVIKTEIGLRIVKRLLSKRFNLSRQ